MKNTKKKQRCSWCSTSSLYQEYHDKEWGVPKYDEPTLFEFLILEGAQAGLSWITILKKREAYRLAFDAFNVEKVALYSEEEIVKLMDNPGIIRHPLKIKSAIKNAQLFIEIQKEYGSFSQYLWAYVDHQPINNKYLHASEIPVKTAISIQLSKDLHKRGMRFVGPVIMYAYMQAIGMVNDHISSCFTQTK